MNKEVKKRSLRFVSGIMLLVMILASMGPLQVRVEAFESSVAVGALGGVSIAPMAATNTAATQVVTFNPQGGTWPSTANSRANMTRTILRSGTYAQAFNSHDVLQHPMVNPPTRDGFRFTGWWTAATGGIRIRNTTPVSNAATRTLHAQWAINTATTQVVTFHPQGGTWPSPASGTGSQTRTILRSGTYAQAFNGNGVLQPGLLNQGTQNPPTRVGFTFTGWWTAATGGTRVGNTPVTDAPTRTLHAQWAINPATTLRVVFNPNGGRWPSGETGNIVRTIPRPGTFTPAINANDVLQGGLLNQGILNPPTRDGFTFAGWWTATSGGTRIRNTTQISPGISTITLHARWANNTTAMPAVAANLH